MKLISLESKVLAIDVAGKGSSQQFRQPVTCSGVVLRSVSSVGYSTGDTNKLSVARQEIEASKVATYKYL